MPLGALIQNLCNRLWDFSWFSLQNTVCFYSRARTNASEDITMLEHSDSPFGTSDLEVELPCFRKVKKGATEKIVHKCLQLFQTSFITLLQ
jgi:hypothetical protein